MIGTTIPYYAEPETMSTTPESVLGIQGSADLHWTDYLVIAVYFAGILFVGLWVIFFQLNYN